MDFKELEAQILELVAKDEIETAIGLLKKYFGKGDKLDAIILQSGRYFSLRKEEQKGNMDYAELSKHLNQLRANILDFLRSEEEESTFKSQVFQSEAVPREDDHIPIFFSLGSPHTKVQLAYIEQLKQHLLKYKIQLVPLDDDDWDDLDPLSPIRDKMQQCYGCLTLAMERSFVVQGVNKRGSKQESEILNSSYPTPWIHIEATLAYQLDLPFLILKEKHLRSEGMLDDNIFEWRIVRIDADNPKELEEYPIKSFLRMWIEEVKAGKEKKVNGR